jgi:hypothetical protein
VVFYNIGHLMSPLGWSGCEQPQLIHPYQVAIYFGSPLESGHPKITLSALMKRPINFSVVP